MSRRVVPGAGRPIDSVWCSFNRSEVNGKVVKAVCKFCGEDVSPRPERMKVHEGKCTKRKMISVDDEPDADININEPAPKKAAPEHECSGAPQRKTQDHITSFVLKTDQRTKNALDMAVAKCVFACGFSFNSLEHPAFIDMIKLLRPGYQPPGRKAVGGYLLDSVYESLKDNAKGQLEGQVVTLMQDGWSDIHNSPVIGSLLHTGKKSIFLSAEESSSDKKTARYCADEAKRTIAEVEKEYGCKVKGIVTDNENKMVAMRKMLATELVDMTTYGCSVHYLNLLGGDITPKAHCQLYLGCNYTRILLDPK